MFGIKFSNEFELRELYIKFAALLAEIIPGSECSSLGVAPVSTKLGQNNWTFIPKGSRSNLNDWAKFFRADFVGPYAAALGSPLHPVGDVIIPIVGQIDVSNMILSTVFELIRNQCKDKIENSTVDVTLYKIKTFKVLVLGSSGFPTGYYYVNSATTLLNLFNLILLSV